MPVSCNIGHPKIQQGLSYIATVLSLQFAQRECGIVHKQKKRSTIKVKFILTKRVKKKIENEQEKEELQGKGEK